MGEYGEDLKENGEGNGWEGDMKGWVTKKFKNSIHSRSNRVGYWVLGTNNSPSTVHQLFRRL